jgi:hypothetical protein
MSKYDKPEIQSLLLDLFAMHGTDTAVARLSGVGRVTLWRMDTMSLEGKESLQEVDWGGVIRPWHMHKIDALDLHITDVQQRMTHDAGHGQWVPVVHSGEMKWRDDEYAMSLSPKEFEDAVELGSCWHDKKLRVQNPKTGVWERVQIETYIPPTLDAQSKVLASFAPETFGDKRRIDLNVSGGLGVSIIGKAIQPPQHLLDITSAVPAITDQADEAEDIEYDEIEQPPEAVMSEPFTPDPNSPLTEEQQRILARSRSPSPLAADLAARASQKMAQTSAPVAAKPLQPPPPSAYKGNDPDDCIQRIPRGMKVV